MKTSSSRTEEWIWTLVSSERNFETWHAVSWIPSLCWRFDDCARVGRNERSKR